MDHPTFEAKEKVLVKRQAFHRRFEQPWIPSTVVKFIGVRPACYKVRAYDGSIGYATAGEIRKDGR